MKITKQTIIDKAELLGWCVEFREQTNYRTKKQEKYAEFSKYSPAGEDFSFVAWYDKIADLPELVEEYYNGFDAEEHAGMWVEARRNGDSGVPSIRVLVEDADEIEKMLRDLSVALYAA